MREFHDHACNVSLNQLFVVIMLQIIKLIIKTLVMDPTQSKVKMFKYLKQNGFGFVYSIPLHWVLLVLGLGLNYF